MAIITLDSYLSRIAEKTVDNTSQLRNAVNQRRNGMEDLYGVAFTANGTASKPAKFHISVSPDLVYYEQFAFKFIISDVGQATDNWRVVVSGADITAELREQVGESNWMDGAGIFPKVSLGKPNSFFDFLDVACVLNLEEDYTRMNEVLKPEFKAIEVYSDTTFTLEAHLYLKYSHLNR